MPKPSSTLYIALDPASAVSTSQQIVDGIKARIAHRGLAVGEQLPTVRDLAVNLRINRNTVGRAYSLLEAEGIIETRVGSGSFVIRRPSPLSRNERERRVTRHLQAAVIEAWHQDIGGGRVKELLDCELETVEKSEK